MGSTYAQGYFVLLQSGNRQPFYVRLGTQLYSSTSTGHLILSRLKDSTYMMSIGFAGQPGVEQTYTLAPSQKDQEFAIRDHGEAGWGLYDEQSGEWITALSRSGGREEVRAIGVRRDDAFSRMMAGVVHDTAVLYNDYANSELAVAAAIQPGTPAAGTPTTGTPAKDTPSTQPPGTGTTNTAVPSTQPPATGTANTAVSSTQPPATGTVNTAALSTRPDTATAPITRIDTPVIKPEAVAAVATRPASAAAHQPTHDTPAIHSQQDSPVAAMARPDTPSNASKSDPPPAIDSSARPTPSVVKLSERKLTRNMRLVYADKGKDAKADTVVVIIPLDTPLSRATKPRNAVPDSSRATAAKVRTAGPDSGHAALPQARNTDPDSSRATSQKSHSTSPDSPRTSTVRSRTPDSPHTSEVKPRTADSPRTSEVKSRTPDSPRTVARSKGDSPSNVRVIVPTPIAQPADKSRPNDSAKKPATKSPLPYVNSDCHAFATDYDVDKLRVKMLEAAKDDERLAAALKIFKAKCFYTRQIKALSEVFPTDASKYRFFETAYPFAADEHFHDLGALLNDPVYVNKFKTLVH